MENSGHKPLCDQTRRKFTWVQTGSHFVETCPPNQYQTTIHSVGSRYEQPLPTHYWAETTMKRSIKKGFTLIELVIVILILGIIAAVAAPRMFDTARDAEENSTHQQLAVLRNAIEMARARDGQYPVDTALVTVISPMLNGPFPSPSIGTARGLAGIYYDTTATDVAVVPDTSVTTAGWAYKPYNGQLRLNVANGTTGADW